MIYSFLRFVSYCTAAILGCQGALLAQAAPPMPAGEKAFGVLSKLAGTAWGDRAGIKFEWVAPGKVMRMVGIGMDDEINIIEFRLSSDGTSIIVHQPYNMPNQDLVIDGEDSYSRYDLNGKLSSRCQLAKKGQALLCEYVKDGIRQYSALNRSTPEAHAIALQAAAANRDSREKQRSDLRKQWGALADYIFCPGRHTVLVKCNAYFEGIQTIGKRNRGAYQVAFEWVEDDGQSHLRERWIDREWGVVRFDWWTSRKNPSWLVREGWSVSGDFFVNDDGVLQGRGRLRNENSLTVRTISFSLADGKFVFKMFDGSDVKMLKEVKEEYVFNEVDGGIFEAALASYTSRENAKRSSSGSGDGIGGMLAGALIGGALTGGSPEGIMAGAQAMAPTDAMRDQLAASAAEIAARQRAQAADTAAFRARIADTVRANQPASTAYSPDLASTAQARDVRPGMSTASPVRSSQGNPVSGSAGTAQLSPETDPASCSYRYSPNSAPGCPVRYQLTWGFAGLRSNAQCYSSIATFILPENWGKGASDDLLDLLSPSLIDAFKAKCRAAAPSAKWATRIWYNANIGTSEEHFGVADGESVTVTL